LPIKSKEKPKADKKKLTTGEETSVARIHQMEQVRLRFEGLPVVSQGRLPALKAKNQP